MEPQESAMLMDEAPEAWRERVRFHDYVDGGELSLLKKAVFHHVGPAVMRRLLCNGWQLVKEVEKTSGARVSSCFRQVPPPCQREDCPEGCNM